MDFSKNIIKEIGLNGPFGINIRELFERLEISGKDNAFQEFIWKQIKKLKLGMILVGRNSSNHNSNLKLVESSSLEELKKLENLRLTVAEKDREWAVMGSFYGSLNFSDFTFLIFSLIAKSKSFGISQVELAKAANTDPKVVFHHLKVLGNAKVIVKYPIIFNKAKTHLCIHVDFAEHNEGFKAHVRVRTNSTSVIEDVSFAGSGIHHADLVKVKISSMLEISKTKILATDDVYEVIEDESEGIFNRRIFNRTLNHMQMSGHLEIIFVAQPGEKTIRAIKLLTPFKLHKSKEFTGFEKNSESSIRYALKRSNDMILDQSVGAKGRLLCDLPVEWQVFRLIYLSGAQGITANVIFSN